MHHIIFQFRNYAGRKRVGASEDAGEKRWLGAVVRSEQCTCNFTFFICVVAVSTRKHFFDIKNAFHGDDSFIWKRGNCRDTFAFSLSALIPLLVSVFFSQFHLKTYCNSRFSLACDAI